MKTKEQLAEMSKEDLIEYVIERDSIHEYYTKVMIEREKRVKRLENILNSVGIIMETYTK
ncbi:MAG: hypothetical protein ACRCZY_01895 [Phocaeicola sp.]